MKKNRLENIARENGTPVLIIDHAQIRKNYQIFTEKLPRIQAYYAVKANPELEIIKTLYKLGSSFDVASESEFNLVISLVKHLTPNKLQDFIWNKVVYANPVKKTESLSLLNLYKPLLVYDCIEEMKKIKEYCPNAGLLLRIKVPNEGSIVQLSNKFGIDPKKAPELIEQTINEGIGVEGISFHTGSQCNNPLNFIRALESVNYIFEQVEKRGLKIGETITKNGVYTRLVDIGGGFPVKYNGYEQSFEDLANILNREFERLFPSEEINILAEPGRFLVAKAGTAFTKVILAKHSTTPVCYHIDDGTYHTFSNIIFDHVTIKLNTTKKGKKEECHVFGPTCDGLDTLSKNPDIHNTSRIFLPRLTEGDLIYAKNMGAYTNGSATYFNGYPPAEVLHINMN